MILGDLLHADRPWCCVLCQGVEARTRKVVWNRNDNRVKLVCLCKKTPSVDVTMPPSPVTETVPGDGAGEVAATQSMW